jgi:chemotaxis protein methyltransferase CheR
MNDSLAREFHFTDHDFLRICKLIYDHAGISLNASKQALVYSRISRRLRVKGLNTFREYLNLLEQNDEPEWEAFVNSLTTNLTSFFREQHHFAMLAEQLKKIGNTHPIVIWCAACSTGEEAYSLAMTAMDVFNSLKLNVKIIATDLDTSVLDIARRGVYAIERLEKLDEALIKRYFLKGTGARAGFVKVRPELQRMVAFRRQNLLDANWSIRGKIDVIFCRNVMIYFDKATQLVILKKMAYRLRADGLLYAGHSENFYQADAYFKLRGKTVYELSPVMKEIQCKVEKE